MLSKRKVTDGGEKGPGTGRISADLLGEAPGRRAGPRGAGAVTNLRSLQTASPSHRMALTEIDASGSFALICLNMIFFYPTASMISFSFPS